MINKNEFLYKMDTIIEYLKRHNGYECKMYNFVCPGYGEPDSTIVEYAEDIKEMINSLINNINE